MFILRNQHGENLKKIYLSKKDTRVSLKNTKIRYISYGAFSNTNYLEEIELPDTLTSIRDDLFSEFTNLKKVILPKSLQTIYHGAFLKCINLKEINLPDTLTHIDSYAFAGCESLKEIRLPNKLTVIAHDCFRCCFGLENIIIPNSVKVIEHNAFALCKNLKEIVLPEFIEEIDPFAFDDCNSLSKITLKDWRILLNKEVQFKLPDTLRYIYIDKNTNEMIITSSKHNLENNIELDLNTLLSKRQKIDSDWKESVIIDILFKDVVTKDNRFKNIITRLIKYNLDKDNYQIVIKDINNKDKFNKLLKYIDKSRYNDKYCYRINYNDYEMFKLAYALGVFSENKIDRQRACEFIKNIYEKGLLDIANLHANFDSMKVNGFNKDFADFVMNKENFKKLIELEARQTGYISRIYNSFNSIKEFGRSNRGSQRYRKVTIEMCEEYFSIVKFEGVTSNNEDISKTIKEYTHNQDSFDNAVKIRKKYLDLKEKNEIQDHLLGEELKEIRKKILKDASKTLENLNELSNEKFTYDFLSKYDPKNFILGKYCSCCAHLEGAGFGIMSASILHPDCQNLVIKDENDEIIAKSTLYINRKKGYGVFNTVEINLNVDNKDRALIYEKYIQAINQFVRKYNQLNDKIPIKQINVGMGYNDLADYIRKNNSRSNTILNGVDFLNHGGLHQGDWQGEQYTVYKRKS